LKPLFKDIGEHGQQTINQKHVLIVGMGALGTHVAEGLVWFVVHVLQYL
jgi:molybdopterin/thiamine biosynthesis adenylyltransferase